MSHSNRINALWGDSACLPPASAMCSTPPRYVRLPFLLCPQISVLFLLPSTVLLDSSCSTPPLIIMLLLHRHTVPPRALLQPIFPTSPKSPRIAEEPKLRIAAPTNWGVELVRAHRATLNSTINEGVYGTGRCHEMKCMHVCFIVPCRYPSPSPIPATAPFTGYPNPTMTLTYTLS